MFKADRRLRYCLTSQTSFYSLNGDIPYGTLTAEYCRRYIEKKCLLFLTRSLYLFNDQHHFVKAY